MGNCGSKGGGAKDAVSTSRKADLKNGALKHDENNKKIVDIGHDTRSEATTKGDIGASTSASVTSEESSPRRNNPTESASKQSKKGCDETQSVELIVNVSEAGCVDGSNSGKRSLVTELPEHDENSDSFSYGTMECEEDSFWKDTRGNGNLSMDSFDDTNENNGIRIVNHSNLYSHSEDDNRHRDQDLKKDTLLSVPTTETEAESFEDMVRNEGDSIDDDDRSVSTSDWSESMTDLIKLCEEDSGVEDLIAEDDNEGTLPRSDNPGQATFDLSRSPSKTADNISLLKHIPEHPSSDVNDVSNLAVASPKTTNDTISDERIVRSPSIPATLKISQEDVASQSFSPLAVPQTSCLSERGLIIDEYSGVGGTTCPNHEHERMLPNEKTVTPLLREQSSTQMALSEEQLEIPLLMEGKETLSVTGISALLPLDALEKTEIVTDKLNASHAATMSLSSESVISSMDEKDDSSLLMSDVMPMLSAESSPVAETSKVDENIDNRSLSSLTSTFPAHNRPSKVPKMKSPCKTKSSPASLSPYKNSVRISSIPAASPRRLSSATSPQKITTRNSSIASPRPLSANPIMKSPSPSPIKKGTNKSSIPRVSPPSPSPYKYTEINSSIRGSSITPSTKASPATCASSVGSVNSMLGSVNSLHSASSITVRERKKSTQDRISQYKSLKGCSNRWNPNLYSIKKPCSRCYSLASDKEKEKFEANGRHTVITLTSGGCTKSCSRFICKDDEEGVVLCRICFNAVHTPAKYLKDDTCRSLTY